MKQESTSRKGPDQKPGSAKGSLMAAAGAACWGFSGCCGQFLFEERGVQAPWLVTLRLVIAGIFLIINSNFAHRFCLCTLKIQYLAGIRLSKFHFLPYAA